MKIANTHTHKEPGLTRCARTLYLRVRARVRSAFNSACAHTMCTRENVHANSRPRFMRAPRCIALAGISFCVLRAANASKVVRWHGAAHTFVCCLILNSHLNKVVLESSTQSHDAGICIMSSYVCVHLRRRVVGCGAYNLRWWDEVCGNSRADMLM